MTCPHCGADLPAATPVCPACNRSVTSRLKALDTIHVTEAERAILQELRQHTDYLQDVTGKLQFVQTVLIVYIVLCVLGATAILLTGC